MLLSIEEYRIPLAIIFSPLKVSFAKAIIDRNIQIPLTIIFSPLKWSFANAIIKRKIQIPLAIIFSTLEMELRKGRYR
jgi:hypothetical protein